MQKYMITVLLIVIMIMVGVREVDSQTSVIKEKNKYVDKNEISVYNEIREEEPNYIMEATGYDLSIQCCGKSYSNSNRGIAKDGYNLNNKSHSEAWTVSSNKFPLGTKLELEFPESHKKYSGQYVVRDTGNFAKSVLDIYLGDFGEKVHQDTINFGRVEVKVWIIE